MGTVGSGFCDALFTVCGLDDFDREAPFALRFAGEPESFLWPVMEACALHHPNSIQHNVIRKVAPEACQTLKIQMLVQSAWSLVLST